MTETIAASPVDAPPLELYAEERTHCSKSEAGLWALARDPSLQAVHDALRLRAGDQVQVAPQTSDGC